MTDKYYVYRPMLDLIGYTEGTDEGRGYNETLAYGAYTGGPVDLVSMSLGQVDRLQTSMLTNPKNKHKSSAAGRYQIVRTTRRSIEDTLKLPASAKFDADMQDRMGCYLLGVRGIDKYLAGRLSEDTLINNLAQEWASLPTTQNKGYYDGQNARVPAAKVRQVLAEVKRRHKEGQPVETVEVEKPIVPVQVEKEVRQKTGWLSSWFGAGGAGAAFLTWMAGVDPVKVLIIMGCVGVGVIAMLLGGEWIIRRIKSIKRELET